MTDVRAITVKQPWAWAIAHGGKNIENRSRPLAYRGQLLIHAGVSWSHSGAADRRIADAWGPWHSGGVMPVCFPCPDRELFPSAVLAVAELVDVHRAALCCNPWGEHRYRRADGVSDIPWHYVLADVRALPSPVPAAGRLGLWRPSDDVVDAVYAQLEVAW